MNHPIKILFIFLLLSSIPCDLISQENDSIARLKIHVSLNGYYDGEYPTNWIKAQNCLMLEIDTVFILVDKQEYINSMLEIYKKHNKKLRRNKERKEEIIIRLGKDYDNYKPLEDYQYYKNAEIEGFRLSGSRCCYVTSADSESGCLSESQVNYLNCLLPGDQVWFSDIKIAVSDSIYDLRTSLTIKIGENKKENKLLQVEIDVINDVFATIADYGKFYRRGILKEPKLDTIFDDTGKVVGYDTEKFKKEIERFNSYYSTISSTDTNRGILVVIDTLYPCWRPETVSHLLSDSTLTNYYEPMKSFIDCEKEKHKFEPDKITNTGVFILKNKSKSPDKPWAATPNNEYSFFGTLAMSRVYFNKELTKAVVSYSYLCNAECGSTNLLFLKKEDNIWVIDKIKLMGVF